MRLPGRLWFKDQCAGITWQHRLADPATVIRKNDGKSCYAVSVEADKAVYYSDEEDDATLRLLYCHETHHRPSMVPAEGHALEKIYGAEGDDEVYCDREESASTYYGRVMNETLGPFLRLPKPPRNKKKSA